MQTVKDFRSWNKFGEDEECLHTTVDHTVPTEWDLMGLNASD